MPASIIGSSSGASAGTDPGTSTITVTLDQDLPSDGALQVMIAHTYIGDSRGYTEYSVPVDCIDSHGRDYMNNTGVNAVLGIQGIIRNNTLWNHPYEPAPTWPPAPPNYFWPPTPFGDSAFDSLWIGSCGRGLQKGDLLGGDTITLTWLDANIAGTTPYPYDYGDPIYSDFAVVLLFIPEAMLGTAVKQRVRDVAGGNEFVIYYDNGDAWPTSGWPYPQGGGESCPWGGGLRNTLSWYSDLPVSEDDPYPRIPFYPEDECLMVSIAAALDGSGFNAYGPANGSLIGGIDTDRISLACSVVYHVGAGNFVDPGGSWGGSPRIISGNYQLMPLRIPPINSENPSAAVSLDQVSFRAYESAGEE